MKTGFRVLAVAAVAVTGSVGCAGSAAVERTTEGSAEVRQFDTWRGLFRYYVPRAQLRGDCVHNIGRGQTPPPVIEIDGQRSHDGCPPPGFEPEEIVRVEMLDASEAGMLLGSRGVGGLIRMYTR